MLNMLISIYLISNVIYFGYCLNHEYGKSYDNIEYKHLRYYQSGNKLIDQILTRLKKRF